MIWNLGGKQNQPNLKGKQEEGEFRVLYSLLSTSPSSCSHIDPVDLFDLISAYWQNEESELFIRAQVHY